MTTDELAVRAHLPGDLARYGFATAALHRPHPVQARRVARNGPPTRTGTTPATGNSGWHDRAEIYDDNNACHDEGEG